MTVQIGGIGGIEENYVILGYPDYKTMKPMILEFLQKELLNGINIHTLAKQMGTSVVMLERYYSKLTATMAAEELA